MLSLVGGALGMKDGVKGDWWVFCWRLKAASNPSYIWEDLPC